MKRTTMYILGGILIILILINTSCACCGVKPYSKKSSVSKYEGMDGEDNLEG